MSRQPSADDVLDAFCMEPSQSQVVLRRYIERYPQHAVELLDFFHDLELFDLGAETGEAPRAVETAPKTSSEASATVVNALEGDRLRVLAKQHGLPRDFFVGFRDARIRLGSIPARLVTTMAEMIGVRLRDFVVHLQAPERAAATAFRAEQKPETPSLLEYEAFISALELSETEAAQLKTLVTQRGSD